MPIDLPRLNFPAHPLHIVEDSAGLRIFDPVRRRLVALTPEEWVRQNMLAYMLQDLGYPLHLLSVEHSLKWQTRSRRCDIVLFMKNMQAGLIAEIKAPGITISHAVLRQVIRYNQSFRAPFLLLTNGIQHYSMLISDNPDEEPTYLDHYPDYNRILAHGPTLQQ